MTISIQRRRFFISSYRSARRWRHGFHNPRGGLLTQLREKYKDEYCAALEAAGPTDVRYRAHVEGIERKNKLIRQRKQVWFKEVDRQRKQLEKRLTADSRKFGHQEAFRRTGYLITAPRRPAEQERDVPTRNTFVKRIDPLGSLDRYIGARLRGDSKEWLYGEEALSPAEQYKRTVILRSIGVPGRPSDNKKKALKYAREFFGYAQREMELFANLLTNRKVPLPRSHAQGTNAVAKIIVGEKVRYPDSERIDDQRFFWDDSLVNKLATLLSYLEDRKIAPQDVPALISDNGGIEALLRAHRAV